MLKTRVRGLVFLLLSCAFLPAVSDELHAQGGLPSRAEVPSALREAVRASLHAAGYDVSRQEGTSLGGSDGAWQATNRAQALRALFTPQGIRIRPMSSTTARWEWDLELVGFGRRRRTTPVSVADAAADGCRLEYRRGAIVEWYRNDQRGLEQGFTVFAPPEKGEQDLAVELVLAWRGDLSPELTDSMRGVLFRDADGKPALSYTGLRAWDATGRDLSSRLSLSGRRLSILVQDDGAVYPLHIDPVIKNEDAKLTAGDGATGDDLGRSVSIEGDTAVVGAPQDGDAGPSSGSAYVFLRSGAVWNQQAKLTASDAAANDLFGASVSISGETVVVGAPGTVLGGAAGAAYVFVRNGTNWSQQAKLTASDAVANDHVGTSVSISGETAVLGARGPIFGGTGGGSAYVFVRSGTNWSEQAKLTASDAAAGDEFGRSVSTVGATIAVGAPQNDDAGSATGSAYVFVLNGAVWSQQAKLTASDAAAFSLFGQHVSMAGETVVIGSPGDGLFAPTSGAAYVYVRSGTSWSEQAKLQGSDAMVGDQLGLSVWIAGDSVVAGSPQDDDAGMSSGSAYVFVRSGTSWSEQAKLVASDTAANDMFGASVSIENNTVVVGAPFDGDAGPLSGSAYVFGVLPPGQTSAAPSFIAALEGRGERAALGFPPAGSAGDDFIPKPFVAVPKLMESAVDIQLAVVSQTSNQVSWGSPSDVLGQQGGSLGQEFPTGDEPVMAVNADFDGDGGADILTANRGGDSVSLLISDETPGAQAFLSQVEIPLAQDTAPVAVAAATFDAGPDIDFAAAGAAGVTVFLATAPSVFGGGSFTPVNAPDPSLHTDIAAGDFDNDGDVDLVTASGAVAIPGSPPIEEGFVTILENVGGGFTVQTTLVIGQAAASVLAGNFDDTDGLGFDDLLVVIHEFDGGPGGEPQARLELWVSNGAGAFTLSPTAFGDDDGNGIPDNEIFDIDGVVPTFGAQGDIDNDGDLDAVYTSRDNIAHPIGAFGSEYPPVQLTVLINDGTGHFAVNTVATAYAGKGISPILQDVAPLVSEPGGPFLDVVLVWFQDQAAGGGGGSTSNQTFVTALVWDPALGTFVDASPNQFLTGNEPGNGAAGSLTGGGGAMPLTAGSGSPQLGPPPEIVVPNMVSNDLSVFGADGAGGLVLLSQAGPVDDTDPEMLFPLGTWEGGPRTAKIEDVNADGQLDAVIYSSWDDITGTQAEVPSSVSVFLGDGSGELLRSDFLPLSRGGEIAVGQLDADGFGDVVVTQRLGPGSSDQVFGYTGSASGVLSPTFTVTVTAPTTLSGGIALIDADQDGQTDVVMAGTEGTGPGSARLVVIGQILSNPTSPTLSILPFNGEWGAVRSLDVGDADGDGVSDILVGAADGQLFLLAGDPAGVPLVFNETPLDATSTSVGGGAIRIGDITGDGILDLVSSGVSNGSQIDQAFVRTLRGNGVGVFDVDVVGGLSSFGVKGSLRPMLADVNGDGALDTVLTHGGSAGTISVQLNPLSAFQTIGTGKAGPAGLVPALDGFGYSTPGGQIDLVISNAIAGVPAVLIPNAGGAAGVNQAIQLLTGSAPGIPLIIPGLPGSAGSLTLSGTLPIDYSLVGQSTTMQLMLLETVPGVSGGGGGGLSASGRASSHGSLVPGGTPSGPPVPGLGGLSSSNILQITIVDGS